MLLFLLSKYLEPKCLDHVIGIYLTSSETVKIFSKYFTFPLAVYKNSPSATALSTLGVVSPLILTIAIGM